MRFDRWRLAVITVFTLAVGTSSGPVAQTRPQANVPSPQARAAGLSSPTAMWGHDIGDDYFLVNYKQLTEHWQTLAKQSPRLRVVEIGKTS